jgi:hypothetical protein
MARQDSSLQIGDNSIFKTDDAFKAAFAFFKLLNLYLTVFLLFLM